MAKKVTNSKEYCELICVIIIFLLCIGFCFFLYICVYPKLLPEWLTHCANNVDLNISAIVLGSVTALAGLLIPLHYALTLDIIENISNSNDNYEERQELLSYCHASDIVAFVTAIFGVSSLFVGAFALGLRCEFLDVSCFYKLSFYTSLGYIILVLISSFIHSLKMEKKWRVPFFRCYSIYYFIFILAIFVLSSAWFWGLKNIKAPNGIAFLALIILAFYYLLWLLLRVCYRPISNIVRLKISPFK